MLLFALMILMTCNFDAFNDGANKMATVGAVKLKQSTVRDFLQNIEEAHEALIEFDIGGAL